MSRDGEDRVLIALGVIQAVKQMHAPGAGGGAADAKPSRVLRIAHRGKSRGFFVPHLNEFQLVLVGSQRLEKAIDTITWKAEDRVDSHSIRRSTMRSETCFAMFVLLVEPVGIALLEYHDERGRQDAR